MATRAKRKPKAVIAGANDPTLERTRRDEFDTIPAPRMADELIGRDKLASTRRQVSRIRRMECGEKPWINRAEAVALERYDVLLEQASYGGTRSCMDMSPRGGGGPEGVFDALAWARLKLATARNAIHHHAALMFVDAVLSPYDGETLDEVMQRMLVGCRIERRAMARIYVVFVANSLIKHFDC